MGSTRSSEKMQAQEKAVEQVINGKYSGLTYQVVGDKLIITVDLTEDLGPSGSGKTNGIATTHGNKAVPGEGHEGMIWSLNVYQYAEPKGGK